MDIVLGQFDEDDGFGGFGAGLVTDEEVVGLEFEELEEAEVADAEGGGGHQEHDEQAHHAG
jgi:hypothetical protein